MKLGVIFVLFALGTFICITCAAPASSEIQQDDDLDSEMTDKELVEIVKQIVNQEKLGDKELAQAELFKSLGLGLLKNINWGSVLGKLRGLANGFLRNARKPRLRSPYYPAQQPHYHSHGYGSRGRYESAKNQGEKEVIKTQQIDTEEFQARARLNEALKDLIATKEQDEEIDDYDEAQAQSETIEELLAAKEQDKEDRDALTAAMKADDLADLVESQDDGEDDDEDDDQDEDDNNKEDIEAELQRKRKKQTHKSRNRHGRRRGYPYRGHRRPGGRRGGYSGRTTRRRRPSWLSRFPWNDILSGVGTFAGGLLGNLFNPSPSPSQSPGFSEKNKLEVQQINDDDYDDTDDNDVAQSEILNELENLFVATQQDAEFDDYDAKFQAQNEVLKELMKILIAAN